MFARSKKHRYMNFHGKDFSGVFRRGEFEYDHNSVGDPIRGCHVTRFHFRGQRNIVT